MSELKKMSMSELIARYNAVAATKGVETVTEFKNLAAARSAVQQLEEGKTMTEDTNTNTTPTEGGEDGTKYNSSGKRGPNQGVGEFAKGLIREGQNNADVLAAVKAKFEGAKTTLGCIAYYRAAVKNPNMGKRKVVKTPDELRAAAQALVAQAEAAQAVLDKKAADEAAATAEPVAA